jgi:hypothetical protein
MDKATGAEGQPRVVPDWLDRYRPRRTDLATWAAVWPFVAAAADRLGLDGGAVGRSVGGMIMKSYDLLEHQFENRPLTG